MDAQVAFAVNTIDQIKYDVPHMLVRLADVFQGGRLPRTPEVADLSGKILVAVEAHNTLVALVPGKPRTINDLFWINENLQKLNSLIDACEDIAGM